jgi:hypothetical protein
MVEEELTLEVLSARLNMVAGKVSMLEFSTPKDVAIRLFKIEQSIKGLREAAVIVSAYAALIFMIKQSTKIRNLKEELEATDNG